MPRLCSESSSPNLKESRHERSEVERLPLQSMPGIELQVRLPERPVDKGLRLRSAVPMRRRMRMRESSALGAVISHPAWRTRRGFFVSKKARYAAAPISKAEQKPGHHCGTPGLSTTR